MASLSVPFSYILHPRSHQAYFGGLQGRWWRRNMQGPDGGQKPAHEEQVRKQKGYRLCVFSPEVSVEAISEVKGDDREAVLIPCCSVGCTKEKWCFFMAKPRGALRG